MYAYINMEDQIGIQGVSFYKNEAVIAYLAVPEGIRSLTKKRLKEVGGINIKRGPESLGKVGFSSCFIFKEEKSKKPFICHQMVYVSNRASLQNPDAKRQFFFIPKEMKTEEEILGNLRYQFFTKALSKLPIPIHKDWEEFVWDGVTKYFHETEVFGALPYSRIYALDIPDLSELSGLVEISHKSFEFKSKFKRIPKLKSVLSVSDINGFDFKDLQKFLTNVGGAEVIESFPAEKQDGLMKAYEALRQENSSVVLENVDFWYTTSIKKIGVMLRNTEKKQEKDRIRQIFAKGWKYFSSLKIEGKEKDLRRAYIGNFQRIYEEKSAAIKNNDFKPIIKLLNEISYEDVREGAEEMAKVCSKTKLSEAEYREHESHYLSEISNIRNSHKEFPTVYNQFNKDYFWEIIDMGEARAWMVGYETNCCQHLGAVGGRCVEYAAKNPATSGVLRITKKGQVVAQSFIWLSDFRSTGNRGLVFDSVETLRGEVDKSLIDIYEDVATHLEKYKDLFRIESITVGSGYLTSNMGSTRRIAKDDPKFGKIPSSLAYTDAKTSQYLLREYNVKKRSFSL